MGNGVLVAYLIISSVLLTAYVIDGRAQVQLFFLEPLWNFVGAFLYTGAGIVAAITWTNAKNTETGSISGDKARNYDAALTMAALCIINGLLYFIDFIFAKATRNRLIRDPNRY